MLMLQRKDGSSLPMVKPSWRGMAGFLPRLPRLEKAQETSKEGRHPSAGVAQKASGGHLWPGKWALTRPFSYGTNHLLRLSRDLIRIKGRLGYDRGGFLCMVIAFLPVLNAGEHRWCPYEQLGTRTKGRGSVSKPRAQKPRERLTPSTARGFSVRNNIST